MAGWVKGVPLLLGVLPANPAVHLPVAKAKVLPAVKAHLPVDPVAISQGYHARVVA